MNNFKIKEITIPSLNEVKNLGIKKMVENDYSKSNGAFDEEEFMNIYYLKDFSTAFWYDYGHAVVVYDALGDHTFDIPFRFSYPFLRTKIVLDGDFDLKDGEIVELGEAPNNAVDFDLGIKLEKLREKGKLKEVRNDFSHYINFHQNYDLMNVKSNYPIYEYEGKKYVKCPSNVSLFEDDTANIKYGKVDTFELSNGHIYDKNDEIWFELKPIRHVYNESDNSLYSIDALPCGVPFNKRVLETDFFEGTNLYSFLNNEFYNNYYNGIIRCEINKDEQIDNFIENNDDIQFEDDSFLEELSRKEIKKLLENYNNDIGSEVEFINIDLEKENDLFKAFIYCNDNVCYEEGMLLDSCTEMNSIKNQLFEYRDYLVYSNSYSPLGYSDCRYDEDEGDTNILVGIRNTDMDNMALLLSKVYKAFSSRGIRVNINGTPINKIEDICTCLFSVRDEYNNSKQYKK